MNRLVGRPWFGPGLGVILYLVGFNEALLHEIGTGWLRLGRIPQTVIVLVVMSLMAYLTSDYLNERRSAYRTAVRAAAVNDGKAGTSESTVEEPFEGTVDA
ncbi:MAG: hypothetical protein CL694_00080 [Chloroflexi bacterium]|nr:hypothetical protein [Chloroflexota bacterium]